MLLRLYRLTDKLGILILKVGAASADWLLEGTGAIVSFSGRGLGSVFGVIFGILAGFSGLIWRGIRGLADVLRTIGRVVAKALGIAAPQVMQAGNNVANRTSEAMARRAARDEIDVIIKEDPLKVQNRRLSFLVLILGVTVLAALIWATDPSRTQQPIAAVPVVDLGNPENTTPEPTVEGASNVAVAPTQIPTATPLPEPLQAQGAIAYTVRERGQTDIWAVNVGSRNPIRITNDVADERDPEWTADGNRLAYAARINGNWDLYVYDLIQNATSRVTVDLSFQANPTWSPDGAFLAYENYQNDNLDIYAVPINASRAPEPITTHPAPDFSPAWGPDGRRIAFVSWRDGNQDIYVIDLDGPEITNITNTPNLNEDYPAWSPDGRSLAYSLLESGNVSETVFVQSLDDLGAPPQLVAVGRMPSFAPDGSSIAFAVDTRDGQRTDIYAITVGEAGLPILIATVLPNSNAPTWTSQPLPAPLVNAGGVALGVSEPLYIEQTDTFDGTLFQLQSLGNVQSDTDPLLSDAVNDSFNALRQAVFEEAGTDYLDTLDDSFWRLERPADAGEPGRNWHRTGRAFSIPRNDVRGFPPPVEVVRETIGNEVYWRVFVRVDENSQRGQLGEPLRDMPWDFLATTQGDVDAFNQGGRLRREVPSGYYIDFTIVAQDYDWNRVPAGSDWVANERARNFWMFLNTDGLAWCDAMLQLYSEGQLINYGCTS